MSGLDTEACHSEMRFVLHPLNTTTFVQYSYTVLYSTMSHPLH